MLVCKNCHHFNQLEAKQCQACQSAEIFGKCANCGMENKATLTHCIQCELELKFELLYTEDLVETNDEGRIETKGSISLGAGLMENEDNHIEGNLSKAGLMEDLGFGDQASTADLQQNEEEVNSNSKELTIELVDSRWEAFIHNTGLYVKALLVNIIVFLLAFYIFMVPGQSKDLINGMVNDFGLPIREGGFAIIGFWIGILLLSFCLWYSSIFALANYDLSGLKFVKKPQKRPDLHDRIITWLPYLFGISMYVILCFAFNGKDIVHNYWGWLYLSAGILVGALFYTWRERLKKKKDLTHLISKGPLDWNKISKMDEQLIKISTYTLIGGLLATLIMSFFSIKPAFIPQIINAGAIITLFLAGILILFNVIWMRFKDEYKKLSISFIILLLIPIFTFFNNNHNIRLLAEDAKRKTDIVSDFNQWLDQGIQTTTYSAENKFPIFLVAAEGGGIRSMKWTALLLDRLYSTKPTFAKHTYAISGVSGGSVGSVFHQAALSSNTQAEMHTQLLEKAVSKDFLAPVTFGLVFPDMVQAILPFPIHPWDRSRWLEDAWHQSFKKQFNMDVLNQSISQYWGRNNQNLAHIFLNCTSLETGQKVLISDLIIPKTYFENTLDLVAEISEGANQPLGIPLKTAASLSARFPLVTSAGKAKVSNGSMQIVDGGYHDNTGLETLMQLVNLMVQETDSTLLENIKISIIFIKNSGQPKDDELKSSNFVVDLKAPISTLLSNWENSSASRLENTKMAISSYQKLGLDIELFTFQLDREVILDNTGKRVYDKKQGKTILLPLGWYLSQRANKEIARQVAAITDQSKFDREKDTIANRNYETFQKIIAQLP